MPGQALLDIFHTTGLGERHLAAALCMTNPYCNCKLTRRPGCRAAGGADAHHALRLGRLRGDQPVVRVSPLRKYGLPSNALARIASSFVCSMARVTSIVFRVSIRLNTISTIPVVDLMVPAPPFHRPPRLLATAFDRSFASWQTRAFHRRLSPPSPPSSHRRLIPRFCRRRWHPTRRTTPSGRLSSSRPGTRSPPRWRSGRAGGAFGRARREEETPRRVSLPFLVVPPSEARAFPPSKGRAFLSSLLAGARVRLDPRRRHRHVGPAGCERRRVRAPSHLRPPRARASRACSRSHRAPRPYPCSRPNPCPPARPYPRPPPARAPRAPRLPVAGTLSGCLRE